MNLLYKKSDERATPKTHSFDLIFCMWTYIGQENGNQLRGNWILNFLSFWLTLLQVAEIISDLMEPLTGVAQDESTEDLFSTPSTLASKLRKAGLR